VEQEDVRHVTERYIARSFPFIVMVSTSSATSKAPGGLLERIGKDSERECLYKRLKTDYNYELEKIYAKQKIQKASSIFEREYFINLRKSTK
jgi:2-oxo-4-hydroxy-4-carboxy--5-ureidoimidazoline (OHCU) decarboxylase